jgi:hypothetical protein
VLSSFWGVSHRPFSDHSGNGEVALADLTVVLSNWGGN